MPINEVDAFQAACDRCERVFEDPGTSNSLFEDEVDLEEALDGSDWEYKKGSITCPDCLEDLKEGFEGEYNKDEDNDPPERED